MSIEIERNSQQLLQRLAKIKSSILTAINPSNRFSKDDNQHDHDVVNKTDGNHSIQHKNNSFNSKSKRKELKICYSTHIRSYAQKRKKENLLVII